MTGFWRKAADVFRDAQRQGHAMELIAEYLEDVDVVYHGHPGDRVVGAVRRRQSSRTLYVLWWPRTKDLRVWDVEEEIPVSSGRLRQMWDSWPRERIVEEFDSR